MECKQNPRAKRAQNRTIWHNITASSSTTTMANPVRSSTLPTMNGTEADVTCGKQAHPPCRGEELKTKVRLNPPHLARKRGRTMMQDNAVHSRSVHLTERLVFHCCFQASPERLDPFRKKQKLKSTAYIAQKPFVQCDTGANQRIPKGERGVSLFRGADRHEKYRGDEAASHT